MKARDAFGLRQNKPNQTEFPLPILPKPYNFILSVFILSFVEVVEGLTPPPLFFAQKQ
jgi:hypothetical protein